MKKLRWMIGAVCAAGMLMALTGCGNSLSNTERIKEDIVDCGINVIDVRYNPDEEPVVYDMEITDISIDEQRDGDIYDKEVVGTVQMECDAYSYEAQFVLNYWDSDDQGMTCQGYYLEGETITPLEGVPEEYVESELSKYYFDNYTISDSEYDEDTCTVTCAVDYDGTYANYHGDIQLDYYFYYDDEAYMWAWSYDVNYLSDFNWNTSGRWQCDLEEGRWNNGAFAMNMGEYDAGSSTIPIASAEEYTGMGYGTERYETSDVVNANAELSCERTIYDYIDKIYVKGSTIYYNPPALHITFTETNESGEECGASVYLFADEAYMSSEARNAGGVLYPVSESDNTAAGSSEM